GPLAAHPYLDPAHHLLDLRWRGRPPGEGLADPGRQLLAVERLGAPIALGDDQPHLFDPLEGGEPASASRALATPADRAATVGRTRVDHTVVVGLAPRAAHGYGPQDVVAARTVPAAWGAVNRQAGMTRTCPGTSVPASTWFASTIAWTTRRGSVPGAWLTAMLHKVSPAWTTYRSATSARRDERPVTAADTAGTDTQSASASSALATMRRRRRWLRLTCRLCPNVRSVARPESNICLCPSRPGASLRSMQKE